MNGAQILITFIMGALAATLIFIDYTQRLHRQAEELRQVLREANTHIAWQHRMLAVPVKVLGEADAAWLEWARERYGPT